MKDIQIITVLLNIWGLLLIVSCGKIENNLTPNTPKGRFELHIHSNVGNVEIEDYGKEYLVQDSRKISVDKAQLYLSDFKLIRLDGSEYEIPNAYILVEKDIEVYDLGLVPSGNYKAIRFFVGLNAATNQKTASISDSLIYKPEMWFRSTGEANKYVFVNFQGKIDTSFSLNGISLIPFSYKIGTFENRKEVIMSNKNYSIIPNQTEFIHFVVDYNALFNEIKISDLNNLNLSSEVDNKNGLASKLVFNIPFMFRYEK